MLQRRLNTEIRLPSFTSRLLGPLDATQNFWGEETDITIASKGTRVWYFVFGAELRSQAGLDEAERLIDRLDELDGLARRAIRDQVSKAKSTVAEFKDFHAHDIGDMTEELFGTTNVTDDVFLGALVIVGLAVTPGSDARAISIDYAVGAGKPTDQVLMVTFSPAGAVTRIAHES